MDKEVKCCMRDMYVDDMFCECSEIWFVGTNDSILYRINANNEIYPIKMLPYKKDKRFRNCAVCYKEKNKIYCFPERGQCIYIFDIEKNTMKELQLENEEQRLSIYNVWFIDEYIWCTSFQNNKLYMINKKDQKIKKIFDIPYINLSKIDIEATCYGKKLYFISNKLTTVLEFSTEKLEFNKYCITCGEKGFSTIAVDGEDIFVTGGECKLYRYNLNSQKLNVIDLEKYIKFEKKEDTYTANIFYRSIILNGHIVLSTENISELISNQILIYNIEKNSINFLMFNHSYKRKAGDFFVISKYSDCEITIYDNLDRTLYLYNLDNQSLERKIVQVGKEITNSFANDIKSISNSKESMLMDLRKYLQALNK